MEYRKEAQSDENAQYKECGILFGPSLILTASFHNLFNGILECLCAKSVNTVLKLVDPLMRVLTSMLVAYKFVLFLIDVPTIWLHELAWIYVAAMWGSCWLFLAERLASKFDVDPSATRTRFSEAIDKRRFTSPLSAAVVSTIYVAIIAVLNVVIVESSSRVALNHDVLSIATLSCVSVAEWLYTLNRLQFLHGIEKLSLYFSSAHTAWTLTFSMPCAIAMLYFVITDPRW